MSKRNPHRSPAGAVSACRSSMVTRNRGVPTRNWSDATKGIADAAADGGAGVASSEEEKKESDSANGGQVGRRSAEKKAKKASKAREGTRASRDVGSTTTPAKKRKKNAGVGKLSASETSSSASLRGKKKKGGGDDEKKQQSKKKQPPRKKMAKADASAAARKPAVRRQRPKQHSGDTVLPPNPNAKPDCAGPFPLYSDPSTRPLTSSEALRTLTSLLRTRKNVIVVAGAGISVSCGIPDFRSRGTGLYSTLDASSLGLSTPEDLFDLEHFTRDPRPFYRFASRLYPDGIEPSPAHRFLSYLNERRMLRRVYTQNVDGLEERAGVPAGKIVQTHGSLGWAACTKCRRKVDAADIREEVREGRVPRCRGPRKGGGGGGGSGSAAKRSPPSVDAASSPESAPSSVPAEESKRAASGDRGGCAVAVVPSPPPPRLDVPKRVRRQTSKMSEGSYAEEGLLFDSSVVGDADQQTTDDGTVCCGGVLKPGVTFFGEKLPDRVGRCLEADRDKADALVVIGTSLSVAPMSKVIQYLSPSIPRILINRNVVKAPRHVKAHDDDSDDEEDVREGYVFDACLLGFCDDVARALVKEMSRGDAAAKKSKAKGGRQKEGNDINPPCGDDDARVLRNVEDEHASLDGTIRGLHRHPTDRILLFPGAVMDADDSDSDVTFREVAQCDGCQTEIEGQIMKCSECFDYDLCKQCYPKLSCVHFDGEHTFAAE